MYLIFFDYWIILIKKSLYGGKLAETHMNTYSSKINQRIKTINIFDSFDFFDFLILFAEAVK